MLYVSIFVELLRARPALAVWIAALLQAVLWTLVPSLFYEAPPGDVSAVLAVGHEFRLGTHLGPPLAFWLAEIVYSLTGSLFGVYALSQACVVATYWTVFALGRSIVGAQHAALAVLLMVGVSLLTVPTPDFGPSILAMPLWALILLHYWRAVGEGRRGYWVPLAMEIGLLLLTSYAGFLLLGLLVLFTLVNPRARASLTSTDPWIAVALALIVMLPHLLWLLDSSDGLLPLFKSLRAPELGADKFVAWLRQMAFIVAAHLGLLVLVALVVGWPWSRREPAPVIMRRPVDPFARQFVYFFTFMPALAATLAAALSGGTVPIGGYAPLVVLSGLAAIVAAGDGIELTHQRAAIWGWFGLLLAPPVLTVAALLALPWIGVELGVAQPADPIARFFTDNYQRRIGQPPKIVAGEPRTAAFVALGPNRPTLFLQSTPEHSPWLSLDDIKTNGAIVVWPTTDTAGTVPPDIKERFPDLVPEVPRTFDRRVQGRLPLFRIGWAVIRPQAQPAAAPAAPAGATAK
jgi:4-amino-4-deoxy-L-arabinose transferase-like glycosyltransferase